jgi:ketosteroid isomerase-like protein
VSSPVSVIDSALESQVLACFTAYEEALCEGDVAAMDSWFADDTRTIRFGIAEEHWGAEDVRRWRRLAPRVPEGRRLVDTRVDLWAGNLAVVTTLFRYPASASAQVGRQSQTWLLTDAGWRIIHAHVSERSLAP